MLRDLIRQSSYAISISGAGLSVASGLPTYRSDGGIWQGNDPDMLTEISLRVDPQAFWAFFRAHWMNFSDTEPNDAHKALALASQSGLIKAHITQNVDGLLQKAGALNVLEMHGNLQTAHCLKCYTRVPMNELTGDVPRCSCGGLMRPDVVMYGDRLDGYLCDVAEDHISQADLIFIIGTSLQVNPLADMLLSRRPNTHLVVIDPNPPALGDFHVIYVKTPAEDILSDLLFPTAF